MAHLLDTILKNISSPTTSAPKMVSNSIELPDFVPRISDDVKNSLRTTTTDSIQRLKTGINMEQVQLNYIGRRNDAPRFHIGSDEIYDKDDHDRELRRYRYENLNAKQREIYNFINNDHKSIILIQAGPGCGKSYTLKTIAYTMTDVKFDTIIYKLDLLESFKYNSRRFTVAKFVMNMLQIRFYQYQALDRLLSKTISIYEFMLVIVSMIKKAKLPNMLNGIVFLDEYTVVSKPILLVTLMLLEYHKIGAIICGDRNQLQNIFNSKHAQLSSYNIASSFAHKRFELDINERCSDVEYNEIISYISQFSCSRKLDDYAYAMVSAIFLRQLIEPPNYHQVHLAGTHQELSTLAHNLVCNNKYNTDFYTIDKSNLRNAVDANPTLQPTQALLEYSDRVNNNKPPRVDKFLPYLPLVLGGRYFVGKHSEYSQGVLRKFNEDGTLVMEMDNGKTIVISRNGMDGVIFEEHRKYLLNGELGKIYSYPIYPAEFMSIHMCQGCTIVDNLDLMLHNTQYQGLYVALSRVTKPEQISRVTIPNQISFIVSTIINFPKHAENGKITVDDLKLGMKNYILYDVNVNISHFLPLIHDFILSTNVIDKRAIREQIINLAREYPQKIIQLEKQTDDETSKLLTMSMIIKYREIFLALSCLDDLDRNVWLHEYILSNRELMSLLSNDFIPNSVGIAEHKILEINELLKLVDFNYAYTMEMSTLEYIESKSKSAIRMHDSDRQKHKKYVVKQINDCVFMESTEFCAKIYNKIVDDGKTTSEWLIAELNEMLKTFKATVTEQPKKRKNNNSKASTTATSSTSLSSTALLLANKPFYAFKRSKLS